MLDTAIALFIGQLVVLKAQHSQSRFGEASYLMLLARDWSYQAGDTACQATNSFNSFQS
ncbi:hypothetical protein [Komarekiella delphini-convector]|uniref:hypothetical protein n=1 Tax=Komarekiella delphini-convector TaxID=3050158 RepID=UPI00178351C0|nr:hypothetical protein [Komarekiella delphini-convector]